MTTANARHAADLVHGMHNDLVAPDWPALTDAEIADVLAAYVGAVVTPRVRPVIAWRSPRPMSSAALVSLGTTSVFVKRHHRAVRSRERLAREHDFARHLYSHGVATPPVVLTTAGSSVVERGEYVYEVHEVAPGVDVYRDTPSWHPFRHHDHARSAGRALALFHRGAAGFAAPAWAFDVLVDSVEVLVADDPGGAYRRLVGERPGLARALAPFDVAADFESVLRAPLATAAARITTLDTQWTHGDWHASNLMWSDASAHARVVGVLDLGLANRTYALRDLAVAIERNTIDWLDVGATGAITVDYGALDGLLTGYQEVSALGERDFATLSELLPVAHVEFALSEVEYFALTGSTVNVALAYHSYLLGHVRWFASPPGAALLAHLRRGASLELGG